MKDRISKMIGATFNKNVTKSPAKASFEVHPVNVPNFSGIPEMTTHGWWFVIDEFTKAVLEGSFTDEDGVGYYAREDKISSVKVNLEELRLGDEFKGIRERMNNGTHVVWLPKQED